MLRLTQWQNPNLGKLLAVNGPHMQLSRLRALRSLRRLLPVFSESVIPPHHSSGAGKEVAWQETTTTPTPRPLKCQRPPVCVKAGPTLFDNIEVGRRPIYCPSAMTRTTRCTTRKGNRASCHDQALVSSNGPKAVAPRPRLFSAT